MSPAYWARHCRETVRFGDALQTLVDAGIRTLVEIGPGATLATFASQGAAKGGRALVYRSLPGIERERPDGEFLLETLGRLWTSGAKLDWSAIRGSTNPRRIALPTYPFERSRHWIAPPASGDAPAAAPSGAPVRERIDATPAPPGGVEVRRQLVALLEDLSGEDLAAASPGASFLELGFDSLSLGRVVQQIRTRFGVTLTFRQLLAEIPSIDALSAFIAAQRPPQVEAASATGEPSAGYKRSWRSSCRRCSTSCANNSPP